MKLYTKGGDAGETSLFDGSRVSKDDPRVSSYGEVDELNAMLGWCRCAAGHEPAIAESLLTIQRDLFVIGAELATPPDSKPAGRIPLLQADRYGELERWIDEACAAVPQLRHFILPGGTELAGRLHVARTCCRRVERVIVSLSNQSPQRPELIVYLNRLSDLLFAWARLVNHNAGSADIEWIPPR